MKKKLKLISIGVCSRVLALILFLGGIELFNRRNPGEESWELLLPLLLLSLITETLFLRLTLKSKKTMHLGAFVFLSWILGLAAFFVLNFAEVQSEIFRAPIVSLLTSILSLIAMLLLT